MDNDIEPREYFEPVELFLRDCNGFPEDKIKAVGLVALVDDPEISYLYAGFNLSPVHFLAMANVFQLHANKQFLQNSGLIPNDEEDEEDEG